MLATTKVETNIYKVEVPATYNKILFKNTENGWDKQTNDLAVPAAGAANCWKPYGSSNKASGSWYTYADQKQLSATLDLSGQKGSVSGKLEISNGTAPYAVAYKVYKNGELQREYSDTYNKGNGIIQSITAYTGGNYKMVAYITDADGNKITVEDSLTLESLKVSSITASVPAPGKVGTKVTFTAEFENEYYYYSANYIMSSIKKDGKSYAGDASTSNTVSFTPTEAGTYQVSFSMRDASGEVAEKTIDYVVKDTTSNVATVYYNNSSWSKAYIHYRVGNGTWTSVPGVAMDATSEQSGYKWKYVIDLGDADNATVCFNNGNNSWDSNNGSNYNVTSGQIGIKNGSKQSIGLAASLKLTGKKGDLSADVTVSNGTAPYTVSYVDYKDGTEQFRGSKETKDTASFSHDVSAYTGGTYKVVATITDAAGKQTTAEDTIKLEGFKVADIKASVASPCKVGTEVTFTGVFENEYVYYTGKYASVTVTKGGKTYASSYSLGAKVTFTPQEAGTYQVTVSKTDSAGEYAEKTIDYVVKDTTSNVITLYYDNSWDNAYVHYCLSKGSWTALPGIKMTASDRAGYRWMYTIDMNDSSSASVCFNNGKGNWDSKNGCNYQVTAGTYGVKNGSLVSLN